jgi:myo-inositol-1(or 4)-monophosphatase
MGQIAGVRGTIWWINTDSIFTNQSKPGYFYSGPIYVCYHGAAQVSGRIAQSQQKFRTMHPLVNIAYRAAKDAADALAHKTDRLDRIKVLDEEELSFLTTADQDSDQTLLYHIQKTYPDHNILSRVSGMHEGKAGEPTWLIDPLLGSKNFARGYPRFGVALAVKVGDVVEHAVVLAPMLGDEFMASRGRGAQLNSRRIRVTGKSDLKSSLVGLDSTGLDSQLFLDAQHALLQAKASPRISGCGALDLLDTACGRLQAGWCRQPGDASMAAASLILKEAGGLIGTEDGNPKLDKGIEMIFGESEIFKQLIKIRSRLNTVKAPE